MNNILQVALDSVTPSRTNVCYGITLHYCV